MTQMLIILLNEADLAYQGHIATTYWNIQEQLRN